jgi:uncharacterized protein YkwD
LRPFVSLIAATLAVLVLASPATAVTPRGCTPGASWGAARADLADRVVELVNDHRASLGLRRLTVSRTLTTAATWKARHMAAKGYFDHDDPGSPGRSFAERLQDCNAAGGGMWGENIAYGQGSARSVLQSWLRSAGHRRNIERSQFGLIGVGVAAADDGTLYWVQDFGASGRSR